MAAAASIVQLDWPDLPSGFADRHDGDWVEIIGWMVPVEEGADEERQGYFLLTQERACCIGCWPTDPDAAVEVFAASGIVPQPQEVRIVGRWQRLVDDPTGWRHQLREARLVAGQGASVPAWPVVSRRSVLASASLFGLAACTTGTGTGTPVQAAPSMSGRQAIENVVTVDLHSHAGRVLIGRANVADRPFEPLADPMRDGGMAVVCLAMVADTPATHVLANERRVVPFRRPDPGELYEWSKVAFARLHRLIATQGLGVIETADQLKAARAAAPSIIVSSEGADFLEGTLSRIEEAYQLHKLRHLQLTHYRVNELGDIQTEPAVHNGLTPFGGEVVRACNRLGIVVDVAHGTFDLVKRAASITTKPLVLSHTSLNPTRGSRSRQITPDHARVIAETGGVIGIWPPSTIFPDLAAMATGIRRMVDVVGVDHVGLGSDMQGLLSPAAFATYRQLPDLAQALLAGGFTPEETAKILGGNYVRVFATTTV